MWGGEWFGPATTIDPAVYHELQAIQLWLNSLPGSEEFVAELPGHSPSSGMYLWLLDGPAFVWPGVVLYEPRRPGVVQLRMQVEGAGPGVAEGFDRVRAAVNRHGFTAYCWRGGRTVTWGASVLFDVELLTADLFRPVVRRLEVAMRQAVKALRAP
jgi:hypothetical protein